MKKYILVALSVFIMLAACNSGKPSSVVSNYLKFVIASDFEKSYALLSKSDREDKNFEQYKESAYEVCGYSKELCKMITESMKFKILNENIENDKAKVKVEITRNDFDLTKIMGLVFEAAFSGEAEDEKKLDKELVNKAKTTIRTITEEKEYSLIKEEGSWKIYLGFKLERLVKEGDELAEKGSFEEAAEKYKEALSISPESKEILQKLDGLKEKKKKKLIEEGDELATGGPFGGILHDPSEHYEEALKKYEEALAVVPEDEEIISKINELKNKINEKKKGTLIKEGDDLDFKDRLKDALKKYEEALEAMPESKDALQKINNLKERIQYIKKVSVYDFSAKYYTDMFDGKTTGVKFKLKNNGNKELKGVQVTVYFKDASGKTIYEENFTPISTYSLFGKKESLKPNHIWQMGNGRFYKADNVPSEWKVGSAEIKVTNLRF